jgi:mono/diheme cytochrome c family protein
VSFLVLALFAVFPAHAAAPALTVNVGAAERRYSAAELLGRRDAVTLTVPRDPSYRRAMTYRAVPLRALLPPGGRDPADTIEARATDGFVAQIPRALIAGKATPWLAIENPAHPWPHLPGKAVSAGPYYLVWQNPGRAGISPEQWPYAIASLTAVASPFQRWPALAVDRTLPVASPVRRGQSVFAANCLTCHRLGGSGEGTMGPDLLRPMAATSYLSDAGLRALIRNPAAVRSWPGQRMPGFDRKAIGDPDLDALIAYLRHLASRRR